MKTFKLILTTFLSVMVLLLSVGCGGGLEAPAGLTVDSENMLSWGTVSSARSYRVEVTPLGGEPHEEITRRTSYSLADLAEGDYDIRVLAVGGSQNNDTSEWSETLHFHKNYESGLVYSLINNATAYAITRVGRAEGKVVIEDEYRGLPVVRIGDAAFRASGRITEVVVGKNVTEIGANAFYNCTRVTSIELPEGLEVLGESAFSGCTLLTDIELPEAITEIPAHAFSYCRALEEIELPAGTTSIGEQAFYGTSIKEVTLPDTVTYVGEYAYSTDEALEKVSFGSGIETIDGRAFRSCSALTDVTFAPLTGELTIGIGAFYGCAMSEIELPEGTKKLSSSVFQECSELATANIPDTVTSVGDYAFSGTALYAEQEEGGTIYVGNWLVATSFAYRTSVEELWAEDFPEGIVGIADNALAQTSLLRQVQAPVTLRYIGNYAFAAGQSLYRFITQNEEDGRTCGLRSIGDYAFMSCAVLSNVRIGEGLENIGSYAFYGCTMLANNTLQVELGQLLVPTTVNHIGTYAFNESGVFGTPHDDGVVFAGNWVVGFDPDTVSASVDFLGAHGVADYAFFQNEKTISIANLDYLSRDPNDPLDLSLEYIGRGAFFGCTRIGQLSLSRMLRTIKEYTFYDCSSLFSVDLPARLENIEQFAFRGCTALMLTAGYSSLDLSATSLVTLGPRAFSGCTSIQAVVLPETLEEVGDFAFYGCDHLASLTLPDSVKTIGHRAFATCIRLASVDFGEGLEEIGDYAFKDDTLLGYAEPVRIPASVKRIGNYAFYNCWFLSQVVLEEGVEEIGDYAFSTSGLRSVVFPASIKRIGKYAFRDCTKLLSAVFPATIGEVGQHAFYGCDRMTAYLCGGEADVLFDKRWNSANRPIVWNATVRDGYVYSLVTGQVENDYRYLQAPARAGYAFLGWATEEGGEAVYTVQDLLTLEAGITLYSVWEEAPVEPPEIPTIPDNFDWAGDWPPPDWVGEDVFY